MKFKILGQYPREGKRWQIGEDLARELENCGKVEIVKGIVKRAVYPEDEDGKESYDPFWSHLGAKEYGTAEIGKSELNKIMGKAVGFDTVKPVALIKSILFHVCEKDSIVLDSFAGSGTTAHAVSSMNKVDGGNRKFILVEMMDYADSITAERVRRVIDGYGEGDKAVEGTGGDFSFYELGPRLLKDDGMLNEDAPEEKIREYIYYSEVRKPLEHAGGAQDKYLLGVAYDTAYYFCYEKDAKTTLDRAMLARLKTKAESYVIYADKCDLSPSVMRRRHITFKKIPRDITRF